MGSDSPDLSLQSHVARSCWCKTVVWTSFFGRIEELEPDLDNWSASGNNEWPHLGCHNHGKCPVDTVTQCPTSCRANSAQGCATEQEHEYNSVNQLAPVKSRGIALIYRSAVDSRSKVPKSVSKPTAAPFES
jgi:hypothetical protein